MNIDKAKLKTLWYEDAEGNEVDRDSKDMVYQVANFPLEIQTRRLKMVTTADVAACKHKRKYIKRTFGWIDRIKGRECQACHGTQVRKWYQPWGRKWDANGSRPAFSSTVGICNDTTILAMANSGDYTLGEAMLAYSKACEKCSNVLAYKYSNGKEGYAENSKDWKQCNTSCLWCGKQSNKK